MGRWWSATLLLWRNRSTSSAGSIWRRAGSSGSTILTGRTIPRWCSSSCDCRWIHWDTAQSGYARTGTASWGSYPTLLLLIILLPALLRHWSGCCWCCIVTWCCCCGSGKPRFCGRYIGWFGSRRTVKTDWFLFLRLGLGLAEASEEAALSLLLVG